MTTDTGRPSLIEINTTTLVPFQRVLDKYGTGASSGDVLSIVNTGDVTDITGLARQDPRRALAARRGRLRRAARRLEPRHLLRASRPAHVHRRRGRARPVHRRADALRRRRGSPRPLHGRARPRSVRQRRPAPARRPDAPPARRPGRARAGRGPALRSAARSRSTSSDTRSTNVDGSFLRRLPDQAIITNRFDPVFTVSTVELPNQASATFTVAGLSASARHTVTVIDRRQTGNNWIYTLVEGTDYTVSGNTITFTRLHAEPVHRDQGDARDPGLPRRGRRQVLLRRPKRCSCGQPVVDSSGNIVLDNDGNVVLYTAATLARRTAPPDPPQARRARFCGSTPSSAGSADTYTAAEAATNIPVQYLGKEPKLYLGGELAYASAAAAATVDTTVDHVSLTGSGGTRRRLVPEPRGRPDHDRQRRRPLHDRQHACRHDGADDDRRTPTGSPFARSRARRRSTRAAATTSSTSAAPRASGAP